MDTPTIALSGELGSGKSSVAERLADMLGARRESTGQAQRRIAEQRGVSTLELNRLAETDPTIDEEIDSVFRSLASVREPLVVDSRLAWHFLPDSLKVHLVVDPAEAASRVLGRGDTPAERYGSLDEALIQIAQRAESERHRFIEVYGVDIFRLANYDLVIDTTLASPEEVAGRIVEGAATGRRPGAPALLLAPNRVEVAGHARVAGHDLVEEVRRHGFAAVSPIAVAYRRPVFTVLDGGRRLEAAQRLGLTLVPALLEAEEDPPSGR